MICIPIKKNTILPFLSALKEAQKKADIAEIWFDEIKNLDKKICKKIFSIKKKPFIYKVTNGKYLKEILRYKIEFIDLDMNKHSKIIKRVKNLNPKIKIIISYHNFKNTPDIKFLEKIARQMRSKGADIIKIATTARNFTDSLRMLAFLDQQTKKGYKAICLCMGKQGQLTRIAGHLFGNFLMYASLKKSDKTAEGQLTIKEYVTKNWYHRIAKCG